MKNISFLKPKNFWFVHFGHNKSYKFYYFDTLEEAKIYREKVKAFIKERNRLPSREELGLSKRKSTVYKRPLTRKRKSFEVECARCGDKHIYRSNLYLDNFKSRNNLCKSCYMQDIVKQICERDEPNYTNQLGIRNISIDPRSNRYRLEITRNKVHFLRLFDTLEEAVKVKERVLRYFNKHGELPPSEEF